MLNLGGNLAACGFLYMPSKATGHRSREGCDRLAEPTGRKLSNFSFNECYRIGSTCACIGTTYKRGIDCRLDHKSIPTRRLVAVHRLSLPVGWPRNLRHGILLGNDADSSRQGKQLQAPSHTEAGRDGCYLCFTVQRNSRSHQDQPGNFGTGLGSTASTSSKV